MACVKLCHWMTISVDAWHILETQYENICWINEQSYMSNIYVPPLASQTFVCVLSFILYKFSLFTALNQDS